MIISSLSLFRSSWISTYMLVGTAKGCKSVGEAGSEHGTLERLAAYTDVVADFPCGVKEFEWRNQYFYDLGDNVCSSHNGLLRECQEKGLLAFELPQTTT